MAFRKLETAALRRGSDPYVSALAEFFKSGLQSVNFMIAQIGLRQEVCEKIMRIDNPDKLNAALISLNRCIEATKNYPSLSMLYQQELEAWSELKNYVSNPGTNKESIAGLQKLMNIILKNELKYLTPFLDPADGARFILVELKKTDVESARRLVAVK